MGGPRLTPRQIGAVEKAAEIIQPYHRKASAVLLYRELYGASMPEIGRAMGHRDHTSAVSMLRRTELTAMPRYHIARGRALQLLEQSK